MVASISPMKLSEIVASGRKVSLIDVRTPAEFREIHVPFAVNCSLDQITVAEVRRRCDSTEPVYVICKSGSRGGQACQKLESSGLSNVINVEGGTAAWESAGLPVVRGKKTISLERQVRIAAGTLVLVGAALSFFVHPAWIGLSAFIGAGLIFAGVTDTCGMGMVLAKMPWNHVTDLSASTCSLSNSAHRTVG